MAKTAFIFPGQGAQYSGMGKALAVSSPAAAAVFDKGEQLRPGIRELCFHGTEEELRQTRNAQPCLFLTELAAARALEEAGFQAAAAAGFSLGELSAVCAAGLLPLERALPLVLLRGELMEKAAAAQPAFMAAVLRLENERVEELAAGFRAVYPVNYNCPGQLTVSGAKEEEDDFLRAVREAGGRAVPLKVSGGFHSPFMRSAAEAFSSLLSEESFAALQYPIYSNLTGRRYDSSPQELLSAQICSPVRWESIIRQMLASGIDTFVELGPGSTLSGMVQRIERTVRTLHVEDAESLRSTVSALR